jgi:hypothetical protein
MEVYSSLYCRMTIDGQGAIKGEIDLANSCSHTNLVDGRHVKKQISKLRRWNTLKHNQVPASRSYLSASNLPAKGGLRSGSRRWIMDLHKRQAHPLLTELKRQCRLPHQSSKPAAERTYGLNSNFWLNQIQQGQTLAPNTYSDLVEEDQR